LHAASRDSASDSKMRKVAYLIENDFDLEVFKTLNLPEEEVRGIIDNIIRAIDDSTPEKKMTMLKLGKRWKIKKMEGTASLRAVRSSGTSRTKESITGYFWQPR